MSLPVDDFCQVSPPHSAPTVDPAEPLGVALEVFDSAIGARPFHFLSIQLFSVIFSVNDFDRNKTIDFWEYGTWPCGFYFCCRFHLQHRIIYFKTG